MPTKPKLDTNVLPCKWQRLATGWRLWIRGWPSIAGEGETVDQAIAELTEAVMREAPDLDRVLPFVPAFEPPLPCSVFAERFLRPALVKISGDEIFEMHTQRPTQSQREKAEAYIRSLYSEGLCEACGHGRGLRTDVPLRIDIAPSGARAGWVRAPFKHQIRIYSEKSLSLLSEAERAALTLTHVEMPSGCRQRFFELRGPAHARPVGVRALQSEVIECASCRWRRVSVIDPRLMEDGLSLTTFIADGVLRSSPPPALVIGEDAEVTLCLPRARWAELEEHRDAAGLIAQPIGVVAEADCDLNPRVKPWGDWCSICKTWPMPLSDERLQKAAYELPAHSCPRSNFDWIEEAEREGRIIIVAATLPAREIFELAMKPDRPSRTEFIAMRCPSCWRLGWIVLSRGYGKLQLLWRYGLH